ncbi:hypothetical protein RIF29_15428 [Crotalaria pallida]|uniref:Uncharacterized protein n=1 Tax=Crotalaria pallida TaxID=3830 RepID=A0AAN9IB63_CROPI
MELETGCIRHPISILRSYDEKEGSELQNQMQNQQQWDLKSNSVLIVPELSAQVTSREVLFSDVEESIEFARISHRENTSEYSEAVNKFISKGNEGTQSECDAGLLLAVGSVSKEKLLLVPVQKPKGQYEDPLAVLKSILLGSQKPSPKAAYSTRNVNIGQAFHDLECLLEMSLDNIFRDIQLQQQLQISLECIKQASDENVSPSLMKLAKSMTSSIDETFENFSLTQKVVEDHTNRLRQKEKLLQQTTDAQKQRELLREKRNQYEVEAESIDKEAGKLDEEKQTLLKEALEKCDGEVKKLEDEAMNCIAESKELVLAIMSYESSYIAALSMQEKLNDNWGSFRTALAERHSSDQPQSCFQLPSIFVLKLQSSSGFVYFTFTFGMEWVRDEVVVDGFRLLLVVRWCWPQETVATEGNNGGKKGQLLLLLRYAAVAVEVGNQMQSDNKQLDFADMFNIKIKGGKSISLRSSYEVAFRLREFENDISLSGIANTVILCIVIYSSGRFNQGNAAAGNNVTTWSGTCFVTPLIGAFIADAYLGRY